MDVKNIIGTLYDCKCDIFDIETQKGDINNTRVVKTFENLPCRVSYSHFPAGGRSRDAAEVDQKVKLFISPEIPIKSGCCVEVFKNGVKTKYECAGESAVYENHQEINMIIKKRYS